MTKAASLISEESVESGQGFAPALLAEVTRGPITESRHYGHLFVVDGEGRMIHQSGDAAVVTYLRSSAKPQQAIPLISTGAADHFGFTDEEIAVACASHNGEREHTEAVASMLARMGLDERALRCGAHEPYGKEAAEELKQAGRKPTALHNNCSGKHAGMLALALHLGAPLEGYEELEHPVQQMIERAVIAFSDIPVEEIIIGVDGCSAPNFAVPLRAMALMYARLVLPPVEFDASTREAAGRVVKAMLAHPLMVEGRSELDTQLMLAARGRVVSKVGAEGVYTAGVLPSERFPKGLGIAFKIEDGDKADRVRSPLAVGILRELGLLGDDPRLEELARKVIRNHRGDEVGQVLIRAQLERTRS